jgi:hypothetical protein
VTFCLAATSWIPAMIFNLTDMDRCAFS